jgi:wyosine [tRNA(Phe)-imidazoG37] synthetase (radical SAM superfamily)
MGIVYGPVPSRRLGMSLGIDPIPRLVCTFDCVYCQLGRKRLKVRGPEEVQEPFPSPSEIADEVKAALEKYEHIDYITFSGSGEPTLNPDLEETIAIIHEFTNVPVALITNSSLLTRRDVFEAAASCDLVLPTLDAGDQNTFVRINRPAPGFKIDEIADSIGRLAQVVPIWLEVMLLESEKYGSNVTQEAIAGIIEKVSMIRPHEVNLNTCVRPPEEPVDPISEERLGQIRARMETALPGIPVVVVPKKTKSQSKLLREEEISAEILRILTVRPCTTNDLTDSLGINPAEVGKYLARLAEANKIKRTVHKEKLYYAVKEN